ncbi:mycothiol synthase [Flexivirga caeni]|uniref:Mycothiol acetyltransferase n=1 Tax=Flexivirga caeni TaxID=2294115 RepID=A0A3M9MDZ3_9MICO|nr:mycothiol synthase [Flexivirga caeni]RNI23791.1 mycothiol synthase [Flexivirga caeni]
MTAAEELLSIAERATSYDGVEPFSEQTRLALRHTAPEHVITSDGVVVAGAHVADDGAVELVVDPAHRRHGFATRIVQGVLEQRPSARFWAHGDLPAAQALAASAGMTAVRNLWRMSRAVEAAPPIESPTVPTGFTARTFTAGDEDAWLDLNRRAFAHHPEQGRMTRADFDERAAEPWWDPAGLILVVDDATGELAASHWTKIEAGQHDTGEVYVVAVDPGHQGHGLGKVVTALGLAHLAARGVIHIDLYVEGDNTAAVATYRRLGFASDSVDVMYAALGA